tara:strand:- start:2160 stop:2291 length:132 start_codon:yes stop_codon:yes gene_type:complete
MTSKLIKIKTINEEKFQIKLKDKPTYSKSEIRQIIQELDNSIL